MKSIPGYRFTESLSEDARTVLFRGEREDDDGSRIIKLLRAEAPEPREIAMLRHEFEVTRELAECTGVLQPLDLERSGNGVALVYENFDGEPLANLISPRGLDVTTVLEVGISAADTLGTIHSRQVIHKHVQPSSILVSTGNVSTRLTDFSICSRLSQERGSADSVQTLEGTLAYISPEQTGRMNRSIDYRTDLYSLGVTLYEMLTGRVPFEGTDALELVHCHIARTPTPPCEVSADIPTELSDILMKLLAKRAEDRYQSAFGLKADLEECLRAWRTAGRMTGVSLGGRDVSHRLQIPEKLYGREQELEALMRAFDRVSEGAAEFFVVAGYSGVGKSALIHELHKPIVARRGYFIFGKFDQFKRDIPYSGVIQAFTDLVRQILGETRESIDRWRDQLREALGDNAQVMIEMIPELELIVGPQQPVQPLPPTEAQIRFNLVFQEFVRACATAEHPVALFVDDLQWADLATLQLIQRVSIDVDARYMLQIGAYRDNEVDVHHPLILTLAELNKSAARVKEITLQPLGLADLNVLVSDTVHEPLDRCEPLTRLIHDKTNGNPFYVRQFIGSLADQGLLTLDPGGSRWLWDLQRIESEEMTSNVVDLMVQRIKRLPQQTQDVMRLAACIGNRFELGTLSVVCQTTREKAASRLWEAVKQGLILPVGDAYKLLQSGEAPSESHPGSSEFRVSYRFLHDRVQQAANALIPEGERKEIHHQIGRLMLASLKGEDREERLFDIVNHMNAAAELVTEPAERLELAQLNLAAGQKAKNSTAYEPAVARLRTGIALLPADAWSKHYELAHALHEDAAEAEYMLMAIAKGEELGAIVLANARSPLDKVKIYELRIQYCVTQTRMRDACLEALEVLDILGVHIPKNPTKLKALAEFTRIFLKVKGKDMAELLALPVMSDPEKLAAMRVMMRVTSAAYQGAPDLFPLVVLKMAELSLAFGNGPHSAYGWGAYASVRWFVLGDLQGTYRFGKMAMELAHKFPQKDLLANAIFMFNNFHRHWVEPQDTCFQPIMEARRMFVEGGDLEYFAYSLYHPIYSAFFSGKELETVHGWYTKAVATMKKLDLGHALPMAHIGRLMSGGLIGLLPDPMALEDEEYDAAGALTALIETDHRSPAFYTYLAGTMLAYHFGDYTRAASRAERGEEFLDSVIAMIVIPELNLYQSLALLALARERGKLAPRQLKKVRRNQKLMRKWAASAPGNYRHKLDLVEAELQSLNGNEKAAGDLYDRSIAGARENGFPHEEGLAAERAALHYLAQDRETSASAYMRDAVTAYLTWGAAAKCGWLRKQHPNLLRTEVPSERRAALRSGAAAGAERRFAADETSDSLDLGSVMKASQVISSEIVLDRLLGNLLSIVIQNAGAQRGFLIRNDDGAAIIEARGTAEGATPSDRLAVEGSGLLSAAVVNFVIRTREAVVLEDASESPTYASDPYVQEKRPKSIMAVPTLNQGVVTGVLYVENNLSPGAFTPERLEVMRLLATQAAISLENARLYTNLSELNKAYERFVPRQFLGCLDKKSIVDVELGDQVERELSVLFADIRSFTALSETMSPEESFAFLNSYLGRMEPIINDHGGFIDKYNGDSIMALFENTPDATVHAAIEMIRELGVLNAERRERNEPEIQIGIGINTGAAMLGTIGGHDRMDGTVIGDTVNLADRLEGLTKFYGCGILVTGATMAGLHDSTEFRTRWLGRAQVKGKTTWVDIHEFFDADPPEIVSQKEASRESLETGLNAFYDRDLAGAAEHFRKALELYPDDAAAEMLFERAQSARSSPIPEGHGDSTVFERK